MDPDTERLLLENMLSNIRYTKQQQWQIVYLALLAIGAITILAFSLKECHYQFANFIIFFDCVVAFIGWIFLLHYLQELLEYRSQKRSHLENLKYPIIDEALSWDVAFTVVLCIVIALSAATSIYGIRLNCP